MAIKLNEDVKNMRSKKKYEKKLRQNAPTDVHSFIFLTLTKNRC